MNNAIRLYCQIILSTQQSVSHSPGSLVPRLRLHFAIFSRHLSVRWFISGELILFQPSTSCQINGRRLRAGLLRCLIRHFFQQELRIMNGLTCVRPSGVRVGVRRRCPPPHHSQGVDVTAVTAFVQRPRNFKSIRQSLWSRIY